MQMKCTTRKQRRRAKKAALLAAFCFICILLLGVGMLKAAQRTRQILYGGQPVMAQLSPGAETSEEQSAAGSLELGGGEWHIPLPELSGMRQNAERLAAEMPPCLMKLFLRLGILADRAGDQTARFIMSGE